MDRKSCELSFNVVSQFEFYAFHLVVGDIIQKFLCKNQRNKLFGV